MVMRVPREKPDIENIDKCVGWRAYKSDAKPDFFLAKHNNFDFLGEGVT
jgi:hypothetical protein